MAGLGMAILGGALEQVGTGIADRGKALREEKLKQLSQEREFQFRSNEAGIGADRQVAENKRQEGVQAIENQKQRDAIAANQGDLVTAADGTTVRVQGNKATTILGPDNMPIKLMPKASDTPAEVATMEYLIKNGAAKDVQDAWRQVRSAKSDPEKSQAGIYKMWVTSLTAQGTLSADEIQTEAMRRTNQAMDLLSQSDGSGGGGGGTDPYANDRTAAAGPSKVIKNKPGALLAPPGDGTQDHPFKAAKQADVDWFKQYAKPGDMIEYGGTIYTK